MDIPHRSQQPSSLAYERQLESNAAYKGLEVLNVTFTLLKNP